MNDSDRFLLDPAAMACVLRAALPQFTHVDWTTCTASTNSDLHEMARTTILARPWLQGTHLQQRGRGRAGRAWQNQVGSCLMFSCAFDVLLASVHLPLFSPLAGMAACQALRAYLQPEHQADLTVKWPNDLQWRDAKLAGILVETAHARARDTPPDHHMVIIGIGMNLRDAPTLSQALARNVADWSQMTQIDSKACASTAPQIVTSIVQYWQAGIAHLQTHGTHDFAQHYAQVDALSGKPIQVLHQHAIVLSGVASGVNAQGQLLVQTDHRVVAVTIGEVSVRTS